MLFLAGKFFAFKKIFGDQRNLEVSCSFTMEDNTKKELMEIQQALEEEFTTLGELSYETNQYMKTENELPTSNERSKSSLIQKAKILSGFGQIFAFLPDLVPR